MVTRIITVVSSVASRTSGGGGGGGASDLELDLGTVKSGDIGGAIRKRSSILKGWIKRGAENGATNQQRQHQQGRVVAKVLVNIQQLGLLVLFSSSFLSWNG